QRRGRGGGRAARPLHVRRRRRDQPDRARVSIRVCIAGITGWTGSAIAPAVEKADDLELVGGVSRSDPDHHSSVTEALIAAPADVLVDFTHASAVKDNVLTALEHGANVVIGSSGLSADDFDEIDARARSVNLGVVSAGNFSLTAAL